LSLPFAKRNSRRGTAFLLVAALALSVTALKTAARPDNPPPGDAVGIIEGEAIAVTGPMSVDTVNGQIVTMLRSGSDVRVKSGSARIRLVEGGQISICGPAHLSVLKSGTALTIALDTGTIHAHIDHQPSLTMYTPQIQAQPVAIGDGAQDTVVGFDAAGAMCIRTNRGALRLEQQLTGQSVLVPQGGDVFLSSGQIDSLRTSSAPGHCSCELQIVEAPPPQPEISHLATAEEVRRKVEVEDVKPKIPNVEAQMPLAPKEEPIYQVFVPPLIFDAKAAVQPEVDTKMIVLIRRVRVRPTLIFHGRVEGDLVAVKESVPAIQSHPTAPPVAAGTKTAPVSTPSSAQPPPKKDESLTERVRTFVRKLWP
jgi:hypothetical protein